ncbi:MULTISPECIES: EAL domain-containing protein [Cyanophyceae]|uniref:bifunctional diguanylate cyclase/phosphodiesterase n=1 Tax=Cyanophyceae TaxID=3028117 RepID=UPI0016883DE8|nr:MULTISPECIES: EAL domain-containing protein [Cyanophyceae]MBD1915184.1 EAL domain-containing protein [Phormidium sp. FACHB-77]MBD2032539.1 EAL domain-containing protein [Phormidium sp. FACHB-322]MBD2050930.1 EAL domain-containing protein [Leptolyngbya sp. FACHB-60]
MHDPEIHRVNSGVSPPSVGFFVSNPALYWLALALLNYPHKDGKTAFLALPSSTATPQRLIDVMPGIVFQADGDAGWSMRYLSAGCHALTGYQPEELLSPDYPTSYNTITHAADLPRVLAKIQQAVNSDQAYEVKYRIHTRCGEEKWVWEKGSLIVDDHGQVNGIEGFITDITPLKQSEAALRQVEQALKAREDLLELVLDSIPQPLFWKDSQGRYLGCNQAFATAMGLSSPTDIVGSTDTALPHLNVEETAYRAARDRLVMVEGVADLRAIEPQTYPDGRQGWVDFSRLPMRDADGTVMGVLCTFEDVTAQLASQQALKRREQTLATLAEIQRLLLAWQWDWQEPSILAIFAALGELAGASRVYYYELQGGQGGPLFLRQRVEWSAPGIGSMAGDPRFQTLPLDPFFSDWHTQLRQQQPINQLESDFSDLQRQLLSSPPSNVKSILLLPLTLQNRLQGVMGLSNCLAPHPWAEADVDLLQVVTADLALALERRQAELSLKQAELKYRSMFENAVEGMFQSTPEGQYLTVNRMLARLYGYESPQDLMQTLTNINQQLYVQPGRRQEFTELIQAGGAVLGFESEVYRKDGAVIWIAESARAIYDDRSALIGYEGTVEDITDRKRGEAAILRRDRLLQGVAEASQCLLTTTDMHQAIPQVLARLGDAATADRAYVYTHHPQSLTGEPATTLRYEWTTPTTAPGIDQPHWQDQSYRALGLERWLTLLQQGQSICALTRHMPAAEQKVLLRDGILSILMVPIFIDADLWGYIGFDACQQEWEWSASDESILVTVAASLGAALKRQQTEAQMCYQVYHDALTGLPNRAFFDQHLPQAIARTSQNEQMLAVIFLDLDHFKTINDTLSHAVGDLLLQQVTQRISVALRAEDIVARWGGDEFTLILPNLTTASDAAKVAQRIADQLTSPFLLQNHELHVTASLGIALFPQDGQDMTTLLQNADAAMYRAKQQGRNNYQFYTQSLSTEAAQRLKLETYLHHALGRDEFVLYYQPQVNVVTGVVVQMEALLRWQHPTLGLVAPNQFIPLAEENGLIVPIGEWVLRTACTQVMAWHRAGLPLVNLAVNLAARQLQHPNLVNVVTAVLNETGLPPTYLELEITETSAMADMAASIERLRDLRQLGVKISMDDFGTGYSCLSHLKQFPLDGIKIDRAFVKDLPHSPVDQAMVNAIIAMAKGLSLSLVAEGVETADQTLCLYELGCTEMQGYLFGYPQPAAKAVPYLQASHGRKWRLE